MAGKDSREEGAGALRQGSVRLVQLTDTHVFGDPAGHFDGMDTAQSLREVVSMVHAHDWPADAVALTGDLVHEATAQAYRRLLDLLSGLQAPIHFLPGNHDDPALMRRVLGARAYTAVQGLALGAWQLLFVNTHLPGTHAGFLASEALDALEHELGAQRERPVLILLHHPPLSVGSPWMDGMGLRNADALWELLGDFPNVASLVFGHAHQVFEARVGAVRVLGTPSTCVQFMPGTDRYRKDTARAGYRWLLLHADGTLDTGVRRLPSR